MVLELKSVHCRYDERTVLENISFAVEPGNIACLVGPSGSGKTTLLRAIAGFEPIHHGSIQLDGLSMSTPSIRVGPDQRGVGVVFQDYALFPHLTVAENIAFGLRGTTRVNKDAIVKRLLEAVSLVDYGHRRPSQLSGGQQQRVALARALAPEPKLILLDEPFSNLDADLRERMKRELQRLLRTFGVTALLVTHNLDEAFDVADVLGVINGGRLEQWGHPYQLYHRPACRSVAEFLGQSAFLPVRYRGGREYDSEFGVLTVAPEDVNPKGQWLLLRPDDVIHDDACPPLAEVRAIAFRGMYQVYELRLPSGLMIHCFTSSHHEQHAIGSRIGLRLDLMHAVILSR